MPCTTAWLTEAFPCKPTFLCANGDCQFEDIVCDGYIDCDDGSDEWNCTTRACTSEEFQCTNGKCISNNDICNGINDCYDGSDEKEKTYNTLSDVITSPSFPNDYPHDTDCTYIISQPNGTIISLTFEVIDIPQVGGESDCSSDWLEIRDGGSENSPIIGKYCQYYENPPSLQSTQNRMWIR